ncbi:hypothetical protein M9H77_11704 [Catharanthus roseus]|uniref:Uncharacterized protein n=1 Tax=Catharanthus roseus TaxID=4058 RepID=A0ACC0BFE0_CATRO|nr:hypothetical protein M9H77_11704 [Catharanthus roseus]
MVFQMLGWQKPNGDGRGKATVVGRGEKRFSPKGHVPRRLVGYNRYPNHHSVGWRNQSSATCECERQRRQQQPPDFQNRSFSQYPPYNSLPPIHPASQCPSLEDFVSKYVNSANTGVKSIETVQRSKTASLHNMESEIRKLTRMITESLLGNLPGNAKDKSNEDAKVVTLRREKELVKTSPTIVEEEKGTVQAQEESTPPKEKEAHQKEARVWVGGIPLIIVTSSIGKLQ